MKNFYRLIGIVMLVLVTGIFMSSCNSSKKFEGTWTGYWDGDYIEIAITGSTWRARTYFSASGTCTFKGNTATFTGSDGGTYWVGDVAGNGMVMDPVRWRSSSAGRPFSLSRK